MNLQSSITELKGIGEKTSLPFAKVGIHTVLDLLEYYPRDYEIYEEPVELTEIESGKKYAVHGFVESGLMYRFYEECFSVEVSIFFAGSLRKRMDSTGWNSRNILHWQTMINYSM